MKWKKRQREIKRLRAKHAGARWRAPMPSLREGLRLPTCNNILDLYGMGAVAPKAPPPGIIVDHFHKSGLQVVLPSEVKDAGGKKL